VTRADLIEAMSRSSGLPAEAARRSIEALFGTARQPGVLAAALRNGERIPLAGFGTFEIRHRKPRRGLNPQTRAPLVVPGGTTAAFRPAPALRAWLRAGGAVQEPGTAPGNVP
jgi:nucleoid DNA-binding protein